MPLSKRLDCAPQYSYQLASMIKRIGSIRPLPIVILWLVVLSGCDVSENKSHSEQLKSTSTASTTSTPKPEKSYECMLASLDKGYPLEENDTAVNRYRYLLDSLEKKTTNTRQQIADMTVTTQRSARNKLGKELKLIDILEGSNKVIPAGRKLDYAEVSAMVMVTLAQ